MHARAYELALYMHTTVRTYTHAHEDTTTYVHTANDPLMSCMKNASPPSPISLFHHSNFTAEFVLCIHGTCYRHSEQRGERASKSMQMNENTCQAQGKDKLILISLFKDVSGPPYPLLPSNKTQKSLSDRSLSTLSLQLIFT